MRNKNRVAIFREWLLDTYGVDLLGSGAGVLDVGAGKGELAFQLINLSGARECSSHVINMLFTKMKGYSRSLHSWQSKIDQLV